MSDTVTLRAQYAAAMRAAVCEDPDLMTDGEEDVIDDLTHAVLAVRDREMEQLRTDLAASDEEIARLSLHNDTTCEVVAERDTLLAELAAVREGKQA